MSVGVPARRVVVVVLHAGAKCACGGRALGGRKSKKGQMKRRSSRRGARMHPIGSSRMLDSKCI